MKRYGTALLILMSVHLQLSAQESAWSYQYSAGLNNPFQKSYLVIKNVQPRLSFVLFKSTGKEWLNIFGRVDLQGTYEKRKRHPHPRLGWVRQEGEIIKTKVISSAISIGSQVNIFDWKKLSLASFISCGADFRYLDREIHEFSNVKRNYVLNSTNAIYSRIGLGLRAYYELNSQYALGLSVERGERFYLDFDRPILRLSGVSGVAHLAENVVMLSLRKQIRNEKEM